MKALLDLSSPMWQSATRRAMLSQVVQQSAAELESEIKQTIIDSVPRGRLYRRGSITRRSSKKLIAEGYIRVRNNPKKVIVGAKLHRASAPGQAPARDSSGLINSIRARKIGELSAKVATNKVYAAALDKGFTFNGRNKRTKIVGPMRNRTIAPRPFFFTTAEKFRTKFKQNLADAIKEIS